MNKRKWKKILYFAAAVVLLTILFSRSAQSFQIWVQLNIVQNYWLWLGIAFFILIANMINFIKNDPKLSKENVDLIDSKSMRKIELPENRKEPKFRMMEVNLHGSAGIGKFCPHIYTNDWSNKIRHIAKREMTFQDALSYCDEYFIHGKASINKESNSKIFDAYKLDKAMLNLWSVLQDEIKNRRISCAQIDIYAMPYIKLNYVKKYECDSE